MAHARTQHSNASLTPRGRRKMVDCVIVRGWTIEATAERFGTVALAVTASAARLTRCAVAVPARRSI